MKKLLLAIGVLASAATFAQSNEAGTIQVGLGVGFGLGGATLDITQNGTSIPSAGAIGANVLTGLRAQYGLADRFSAGIYLRKEGAAYVAANDNTGFIPSTSMLGFGLEGKFYAVNKDKFNLTFGPQIGFSTGTLTFNGTSNAIEPSGSASGLSYSILAGINWYWASFIGMSVDLGYNGSSISGTVKDDNGASYASKLSTGGLYFGIGLTGHFGGSGGGGHHGRR